MRSLALVTTVLLSALTTLACSGGGDGGDGGEEQGGGTSGTGQGGGAGSSSGGTSGTTTGGSAGGGATSTGGSTNGGSGGSTSGGSGGSGGGETKTGLCGQDVVATVTDDSFDGFLDYYTVSEEVRRDGRYDEYICQIRFALTRVGEAPHGAGCRDLEDVECEWTHLVELSDPEVLLDENGVCARNQIGQDQAWIEAQVGVRAEYGFVDMYEGHASVVMKYNESRGMWETHELATWNMTSGEFTFNNRANCTYVE